MVVAVSNFTPVPRENYRIGVPKAGRYVEVFNSDAEIYGGSGMGNMGGVTAVEEEFNGRPYSVSVTVPPLATVLFVLQVMQVHFFTQCFMLLDTKYPWMI